MWVNEKRVRVCPGQGIEYCGTTDFFYEIPDENGDNIEIQ